MANRFPLIIDSSTQRIVEIPSGDNLDLTGCNISTVGNINASYYIGNGSALTGIVASPAGSNTQIQFNDAGSSNGNANLTFTKTTGNLNIGGSITGNAALYLYGNGGAETANISITNYFSSVNYNIGFAQSRGTRGSPSALTTGDDLINYVTLAYTGNGSSTWDGVSGWKQSIPLRATFSSQPTGSNGWYGSNIRLITSNSSANASYTYTFDETGGFTATGNISGGNISANIANITTGNVGNVLFTRYSETVIASANTSTSISPNVATGTIFNYTANNNFTFNGFTSAVAGSSAIVKITQDGTGSRTMTSTMLFAGASKTLSTAASSVDIISVYYDGSTYYATLSKGYA
jgi:hypothetical protein